MTYDLHLFLPQEGVSPQQVVEGALASGRGQVLRRLLAAEDKAKQRAKEEQGSKAPAADARTVEHHAALLRRLHPSWAQSTQPHVLTDSGTSVTFTLGNTHIQVAIPFSHGNGRAKGVLAEISRLVVALEKANGFQTYDPQVQRVLVLPDELSSWVTRYEGSADTVMTPALPKQEKRKSRWKFWR